MLRPMSRDEASWFGVLHTSGTFSCRTYYPPANGSRYKSTKTTHYKMFEGIYNIFPELLHRDKLLNATRARRRLSFIQTKQEIQYPLSTKDRQCSHKHKKNGAKL